MFYPGTLGWNYCHFGGVCMHSIIHIAHRRVRYYLNFKNLLKKTLNATWDEVWQEFLWINMNPTFTLVRCATVSFPLKNEIIPDQISVRIFENMTDQGLHISIMYFYRFNV